MTHPGFTPIVPSETTRSIIPSMPAAGSTTTEFQKLCFPSIFDDDLFEDESKNVVIINNNENESSSALKGLFKMDDSLGLGSLDEGRNKSPPLADICGRGEQQHPYPLWFSQGLQNLA